MGILWSRQWAYVGVDNRHMLNEDNGHMLE